MNIANTVTADTITDEQLWKLYNEGVISAYMLMMARSAAPSWRQQHRERCAEILNARAKETL